MSPLEAAIAVTLGVFIGSMLVRWAVQTEMAVRRAVTRWRTREQRAEQSLLMARQLALQERLQTASMRATVASVTRLEEDDSIRVAFGECVEAMQRGDEEAAQQAAGECIRANESRVTVASPDGTTLPNVGGAIAKEIAIDGILDAARWLAQERRGDG